MLAFNTSRGIADAVGIVDVVGMADIVGGQWARWMWQFGKVKGNLEAGKTNHIVVT